MKAEVITSPANPLVREIRRAVERGGLTRGGCAIAETPHLLEEAVRSGCEIEAVLVSGDAQARRPPGVRWIEVPERLFRSLAATEAPQGIIALVRPPEWPFERLFEGTALVLVLDGVQDPGNAGAMLRSAEAFGASGVLCVKGTANPYNPKAVRASAGSVFRVPLAAGVAREAALTALAPVRRYAAAADAPLSAARADLAGPCAIIVGSEGRGVSRELRAGAVGIRIPTTGVESLNAATAAAVLLYEAQRQRTP